MIRLRWYIGLTSASGTPVTGEEQAECAQAVEVVYSGCTVYRTLGLWRGHWEDSLVLEVLTKKSAGKPIILAGMLQRLARQSSVLWTRESVEGGFTP